MVHGPTLFWNFGAFEPAGKSLHDVLLKKSGRADAAVIPFHRDGTAADVRQQARSDRFVIRGKLALGDPVFREQNLFRVGNHDASRTTSRAALSWRIPRKRG